VFGEKDYQQLQVIRRLVADLHIPVTVLGAPTARNDDGLALSSRNAYLTDAQRHVAPELARTLADAVRMLHAGAPVAEAEAAALARLSAAGFSPIDYVEVRGAEDLARLGPGPIDAAARILAAAHLGKTRLIDNMAI
jgi:pantoate--beta-alanine ligase